MQNTRIAINTPFFMKQGEIEVTNVQIPTASMSKRLLGVSRARLSLPYLVAQCSRRGRCGLRVF
jgi:hypothetical protein